MLKMADLCAAQTFKTTEVPNKTAKADPLPTSCRATFRKMVNKNNKNIAISILRGTTWIAGKK